MKDLTKVQKTLSNVFDYLNNKNDNEVGKRLLTEVGDAHRIVENLVITDVSNWVTIESNIPPERCTEVMVKYKDGKKVVAFFDGDSRFYTLKDDYDISEQIVSWHKLP